MLVFGQIKNKCIIRFGLEWDLGKHKYFSSRVINKLWTLECVSLGKEKVLLLMFDSLSSCFYLREAKGQHALSLSLVDRFGGPSLFLAMVPIPFVGSLLCAEK